MDIKLIVVDMDGTFLNDDSQFNSETFQLLKENCADQDIRFVFCTGKQCERVENIVGDLATNTFIVGDSATRIKYNGDFIYNAEIENEKAKEIIDTIREIDDTQTILACSKTGALLSCAVMCLGNRSTMCSGGTAYAFKDVNECLQS